MQNNYPHTTRSCRAPGRRFLSRSASIALITAAWLIAGSALAATTTAPAVAGNVKAAPPPDPTRLKSILQGAPGPHVAYGTVLDLNTGTVVFDLNGNRGLTPASVSKLYATAAAAHGLSFSERFTTRVVSTPIRAGTVKRLFIVGGGDPSLGKRAMGGLAAKVAQAGIKRVKHLVVDTTLFDNRLPRGFNEKHTDASYRAPIDALNLDKGTIVISVERGAAVGAKPVVIISPPSAAIWKGTGTSQIISRSLRLKNSCSRTCRTM